MKNEMMVFYNNEWILRNNNIEVPLLIISIQVSIWATIFFLFFVIWYKFNSVNNLKINGNNLIAEYSFIFYFKSEVLMDLNNVEEINIHFYGKSVYDAMNSIEIINKVGQNSKIWLGMHSELDDMEYLKSKLIEKIGDKVKIV